MATVQLSWTDNSDNEDGFRVYRSTTNSPSFPGDYTQIDTTAADTTTYTDSSAPTGVTVFYAVTAFNAAGESDAATTSIKTSLPIQINGQDVTGIQINGQDVTGIEVNGTQIL